MTIKQPIPPIKPCYPVTNRPKSIGEKYSHHYRQQAMSKCRANSSSYDWQTTVKPLTIPDALAFVVVMCLIASLLWL